MLVDLVSHLPHTDDVIGVTGVELGAVHRPAQALAHGIHGLGLLGLLHEDGGVGGHDGLGLQVVEDDLLGGGDGNPVVGGGESDVGHLLVHGNAEALQTGGEIPDDHVTVLTGRSAQTAVGGGNDLVHELLVTDQVVLHVHLLHIPHLHDLVVTAGNHARTLLDVGHEADAAHPIVVALLVQSVLALAQGVPQLDGAVATSREDQTVVGAHAHGEHVLGVSGHGLDRNTGLNVPETDGAIPGGSEGVEAVEGEADILNDVGVSLQRSLGHSAIHDEGRIIDHFTSLEVPNHAGMIARSRHEGVISSRRSADGSNPSVVATEASLKVELSRHVLQTGKQDVQLAVLTL